RQGEAGRDVRDRRRSRRAAEGRGVGSGLALDGRLGRGRRGADRRAQSQAGFKDAWAQEQERPGLRVVRVTGIKRASGGIGLLLLASGCASAPPVAEKTIEPTAGEDSAFVLSRNPAGAKPVQAAPVHVADA